MRPSAVVALVLTLTCSAPAVAQPSAPKPPARSEPEAGARQCFFSREISSWSEVNETTVVVRVGVSRDFRLDLLSPCPELRQTLSLGLVSHRGGDSICTGDTFDLLVRDLSGQGSRRCNVRSMQPITREEAVALARRH